MKIISKKQIEAIEKLGGTIHDDYITFEVKNQEWGEHCEDEEKIWVEIQKILPGIDGALQGHPLDESDMNYIYFKLDFITSIEDMINWGELSRFLAGSRQTVRKNSIPKIHQPFVDDLIKAMNKVIKKRIDNEAGL